MVTSTAKTASEERADDTGNGSVSVGKKTYGRKAAHRRVETTRPLAFGITQVEWTDTSSKAMQDHVGNDRHAASRLSRILECSPRMAEGYLQGRTAPSGIHFLRAYAMIPEFTAEVRRLTGMEQSLDPAFERDLAQFLVRASQRLSAIRGE